MIGGFVRRVFVDRSGFVRGVPDHVPLPHRAAKSVQALSVASFVAFLNPTLASFVAPAATRQQTTGNWQLTTDN
jgi:hypothetical protein